MLSWPERVQIRVTVNGQVHEQQVEARQLLVDLLRETLGLTGTHIGCDTSYCGACTVLFNGEPVKSCTMFAVQADGGAVMTVEGLSQNGGMHPLQKAFVQYHALQCGYCTSGFLMSAYSLLSKKTGLTTTELRKALAGNTCRCTGYQNIFKAIRAAAESRTAGEQ
jgi:carbon-monoxide dehydrogenase small subunit